MTSLLEVAELRVAFPSPAGPVYPVDGVSFGIARGETLALVGESGCGKSLTSLALLQLVPHPGRIEPGSSVRLGDIEVTGLQGEALRAIRGRRIGLVFQDPMTSLNPVLTAGEQVREAVTAHRKLSRREARERSIALLDEVGIPDPAARFDTYPHQLSGGLRQRVMIAIALAGEPDLLVADEPTTALDVTVQAQILELLDRLRAGRDMAVLLITHDFGVVAGRADRVAVMYAGRIIEEAPTASLFRSPQHPYTSALLASIPRLDGPIGELAPIPGAVPLPRNWPSGCRFHPRCARRFAPCDSTQPEWHETGPGTPGALSSPGGRRPVTAPLLEVTDLVTRFETGGWFGRRAAVHAVNGVSLAVGRGETLALVGESGCGKTTFGRTVLRLVDATSGSVRFDGTDVLAADRKTLVGLRRRMQIVFQDPYGSLDPRMTVGASVAEGIEIHRLVPRADIPARVAALLDEVGLDASFAAAYPHEFSGGQRQRIGIARALAVDPAFIVCDEPVSALDVSVQAQVLNLFRALQRQRGLAYLFIAHDLAVVRQIAHRVAVMYYGRIVELGDRDPVLETPRHPYTRALLSAVPEPDPERQRARIVLPGDPPSPTRPPDGCPFAARCFHPARNARCRTELPALRPVGAAFVACHHAETTPDRAPAT